MIKYCIFDLDGTLLNTIKTINYYVNCVLEDECLGSIGEEECKRFVGDGARLLIERALGKFGVNDPERVELVLKKYTSLYDSAPLYLTEVYEGVREELNLLIKGGVKLAVLSNKPDFATKEVVRHFFGDGMFVAVRGAVDGVRLKPDPEAVLSLLDYLGATREETAFVGDTAVDTLTAKNASLALGVGVLWGFRDKAELLENGADVILTAPLELACEVLRYE